MSSGAGINTGSRLWFTLNNMLVRSASKVSRSCARTSPYHLAISVVAALLVACGGSSTPDAKSPDGAEPTGPSSASTSDGAGEAPTATSPEPASAAAPTEAATGASSTPSAPAPDSTDDGLTGELSQSDIQKIIEKNASLFDNCYTIVAGTAKKFEATVAVKATVGPTGSVSAVEVTKSSAKNKKLDECVVSAWKNLKFPKPKNGATSVVKFPMKFEGGITQ